MDPFSVVAGTIGIADVCVRVIDFVKQVKTNFDRIDRRLEDFANEISQIKNVCDRLRNAFGPKLEAKSQVPVHLPDPKVNDITTSLEACGKVIAEFEAILLKIEGDGSKRNKVEQMKKWHRHQKAEDDIIRLHNNLRQARTSLQLTLVTYSIIGKSETLDHIPPKTATTRNEHFNARAVSSIFTGRSKQLQQLKQWIFDGTPSAAVQRRFVVCGPPGSGKTEFCCKFATDTKQRFWGVFWIDASTEELARQSFQNLASIARVEQTEDAVKSWLSSRDEPWLLILDNADQKKFPITKYYPQGDQGVIIVTTRNNNLKSEGTVGDKFFEFSRLEEDEAVDLLLRAACEVPKQSAHDQANAIQLCQKLDCLPLALTLAGRTIMSRSWSIVDYLQYYENGRSSAEGSQSTRSEPYDFIDDEDVTISTTYELLHAGLVTRHTQSAKDAVELLYILSFLHPRRIRVAFFLRAASNPYKELRASQENEASSIPSQPSENQSWKGRLVNTITSFVLFLARIADRPAIPGFLQGADLSQTQRRIKRAFLELSEVSLIYAATEPADGYSMHPAVHDLIRNRLSREIHDQAVWNQLASIVLSRSILLPPLGDTDEDQVLKRDILPHVQFVERVDGLVRERIQTRLLSRRRTFPNLTPRMSRERAQQLVKFSQVYKQAGVLTRAAEHLEAVTDMVRVFLGQAHSTTVGLSLLLADTYWHQTRGEDAATLLHDVMQICLASRGPRDYWTLRVGEAYAGSLWIQGLIPQAVSVCENAVKGLTELRGEDHTDTLRALSNYGRVVSKDFRFDEAIELNERALSGLRKILGDHHLDTLAAQDNLAMAYFDRAAYGFGHDGDLDRALAFEQDVFERRINRLGRDHYVTLWSGLNLARIKGLRGDIAEALALWKANHAMAEPLLGPTHFGVLFGRLHHGRILMYAKRYADAEKELRFVVDMYPQERRQHPDRLIALFTLIKCRMLQGEDLANLKPMMEEVVAGAEGIFGVSHDWISYLSNPLQVTDASHNLSLVRVDSPQQEHTGHKRLGAEQQQSLSLYGSIRVPSPLPVDDA